VETSTDNVASTKVLVKDGKLQGEGGEFTKTIVFKNILLS
jgi:hypothetical protein